MSSGVARRPIGISGSIVSSRIEPSCTPCSTSAVRVIPGATALTRMPSSATSTAITRDRLIIAAFAAEYGPRPGRAMRPATEAIWTIAPPPRRRIDAMASALQWNVPMRWVWMTDSQTAGSKVSVRPTRWIPALLTRMSTPPSAASMERNSASTDARSATSVRTERTPSMGVSRVGQVGHDAACALGHGAPDDRLPDPARPAGHEDDLPIEPSDHRALPVAPRLRSPYDCNRFR